MKRVIAFITCLIILLSVLVLPEPIEVYAEEVSNTYYLDILIPYHKMSDNSCKTLSVQGEWKFKEGYELVLYSKGKFVYMIVFNKNTGYISSGTAFMGNVHGSGVVEYFTGTCNKFYSSSYLTCRDDLNKSILSLENRLDAELCIDFDSGYYSLTGEQRFNINAPIFESEDQAKQFINGEIGLGSSLNFSDLQTTVYNDSDVPIPRDLQVVHDKESSKYYVTWEQTTEDLDKLSVVGFVDTVMDFASPQFNNILEYVDYQSQVATTLEPSLSYKIDVTPSVIYFKEQAKKLGYEEYDVALYFTVMNAYFSSDTETRFAYYVSAKLILSRSEDGGFSVQFDVEHTDNNFNQVEGSDYNKTTINFNDLDMSGGSFFGFISSGFGLLGNNGLIGLLGATFSFIPGDLWVVMASGIAILFIVALFKLVLK